MLSYLKKGLMSGLVFGIIFIFLMLIGFITVGTTMIGNLLGNLDDLCEGARHPVSNLLVLVSLLGFFTGLSTYDKDTDANWVQTILAGLTAGLLAGLLVGSVVGGAGTLHIRGTDFRSYFPNLCPDEMRFLLFYSMPLAASSTYLIYWVIFSLLGALVAKGVTITNWWGKAISKVKESASKLINAGRIQQILANKILIIIVMILLGIALYFLPMAWGSYWNYIMGTVAIYILLGLGLNIIVGYSGQLVLGYVAFFAIGAYTFALLTAPEPHGIEMNLLLAVMLSIISATLTGLLLGLPILNLRGDYLAIVTLGFGEIIRILIRSDLLMPFTNGPNGVTNVGQPFLRGHIFSDVNYVHLLTLLVLAGLFVAKRLKDSRTGRAWIAIREDQTVAQATGVNTYRYKILALLLGAAFAGLSGALFASRNQFTGPEDFTLMVSVNVLCIVIVGGMGSLPGVVIGAFVLKGLPELLRELADYRLLAFGALLVVMMIVRPSGLWPTKRKRTMLSQREQVTKDKVEVEV
jgi:ABC-type branched-subunit amino acid transport system permease subunit